MALVISHWSAPAATSLSRIPALDWIDLPSPEVALDPILVSEKQHCFIPRPRKLIEMGVTPADVHPGLPNSMAPCSQDRSVTRYASGIVAEARRSNNRCILPANWRGSEH